MESIDDIRQRKLEQLRAQARLQQEKGADAEKQFAQLEAAVKQYFTPEALTRYGTVKTAHPEAAMQLIMLLAQALQNGKIQQKIDDMMLKAMLAQLTKTRDIQIIRK